MVPSRNTAGAVLNVFLFLFSMGWGEVEVCVPLIKDLIVPLPICLGVLVKIPMLRLVSMWNVFQNTVL